MEVGYSALERLKVEEWKDGSLLNNLWKGDTWWVDRGIGGLAGQEP